MLHDGSYSHFLKVIFRVSNPGNHQDVVNSLQVGSPTRVIGLLSLNCLIGSYVENKTEWNIKVNTEENIVSEACKLSPCSASLCSPIPWTPNHAFPVALHA